MKTIVTNISRCSECPHFSHSGSYTPGGAIPLCGKCKDSGSKYKIRELPWKSGRTVAGTPTRVMTYKIPNWCPL